MKKHLRLVLIVTLVCCLLSATAISTFASGVVYGTYSSHMIMNDGTMDLGQYTFSISSLNSGRRAAFNLSISIPSTFSKGQCWLELHDPNDDVIFYEATEGFISADDYEISHNRILNSGEYSFESYVGMKRTSTNSPLVHLSFSGTVKTYNSTIRIELN